MALSSDSQLKPKMSRFSLFPDFYRPETTCSYGSRFGFDMPMPTTGFRGFDQMNDWKENNKNEFEANVDVLQFRPENVTVKVKLNVVTVEAKHGQEKDEHGSISRQFVRRYVLPKTCDLSRIESTLSSDGVLTVTAPSLVQKDGSSREIPVIPTGRPVKKQREEPVTCQNKNKRKKSV